MKGSLCLDFTSKPEQIQKSSEFGTSSTISAPYEIPESKIQLKIKEFSNKIKASIRPSKEPETPVQELHVCLKFVDISDGKWHYVHGGRYGSNLILKVDDAEGFRTNETQDILQNDLNHGVPKEFWIDQAQGVWIGDARKSSEKFDNFIFLGQQKCKFIPSFLLK